MFRETIAAWISSPPEYPFHLIRLNFLATGNSSLPEFPCRQNFLVPGISSLPKFCCWLRSLNSSKISPQEMLPTHFSKILSKKIYPKKCVLAISPKNSTNKCHNIISPIKQTSTTSIPNKTPLQIVKNFLYKDSLTNFPKVFLNEFSPQISQTKFS